MQWLPEVDPSVDLVARIEPSVALLWSSDDYFGTKRRWRRVTRIVAGAGRRPALVGAARPAPARRPTVFVRRCSRASTHCCRTGLTGARLLDLYAGSGAVGLEAWSRGAARVVLVESAAVAVKVMRANVASLRDAGRGGAGEASRAVTARSTCSRSRPKRRRPSLPASAFDVVFADPPYDLPTVQVAGVLATLAQRGVPRPGRDHRRRAGDSRAVEWPLGYRGDCMIASTATRLCTTRPTIPLWGHVSVTRGSRPAEEVHACTRRSVPAPSTR